MPKHYANEELRGNMVFFGSLPKWWKKLTGYSKCASYDHFEYQGPWMDHPAYVKGTDVVSYHPYQLCFEDMRQLEAMWARYKLDVHVSGKSDYSPLRFAFCLFLRRRHTPCSS